MSDENNVGGTQTTMEAPQAGAEFSPVTTQQNEQTTQQTQQTTEQSKAPVDQGKTTQQQQTTQKAVEWTPEKIAELAAMTAAKAVKGQPTQQQQKQMTPEEIDKLLNPVRFDANFLKRLRSDDEAEVIKAYNELLQATVKNSTSVANLMLEQRMRQIAEYARPMEQFYQQQAAEHQKQVFYSKHPNLKPYEKFVQAAAAQVQVSKADGSEKSVAEVMDEIAGTVKDMLASAGVDISKFSSEQQQTTHGAGGGSSVPAMASMQQPGRSQGGSTKGGGNNPDAAIYA